MSDPRTTGHSSRRAISAETVRDVAAFNGVMISSQRVAAHVDHLRTLLDEAPWEDEQLGFRFERGRFCYVRPAHVFRARSPQVDARRSASEE
jgi:hypothetical protein